MRVPLGKVVLISAMDLRTCLKMSRSLACDWRVSARLICSTPFMWKDRRRSSGPSLIRAISPRRVTYPPSTPEGLVTLFDPAAVLVGPVAVVRDDELVVLAVAEALPVI